MAWLVQWGTFVAAGLVVFVPGLVAAWAVGFRRLAAWAFAPVGSFAMISAVATVYGFVRIPWTLPSATIGLVVTALILVVCRLVLRIRRNDLVLADARWPMAVGLVAGVALVTVRVTTYIGDPSNISQTSDAVFHMGAVRAIIEHETASSFGLAGLIDPNAIGGFYPGAWHATDSLITMLVSEVGGTGTLAGDIAVVTNVLALVVAAGVWPLGIAWLTQVATGRRLAAAAAAAMSAALLVFPMEMLQYGVLYPYFLAVALTPAAIAAVVALTRQTWSRPSALVETIHHPLAGRITAVFLAFGMGSVAVANAQPSAMLALWLAVWIYGLGGLQLLWRYRRGLRWWAVGALVVSLGVLALAWLLMGRSVTAGLWGAKTSGRDAFVSIVSGGLVGTPQVWWIAALMFVGLVAVMRRAGTRWLALCWFAFAFLAFVAYAVRTEFVRLLLVGPWYSDPYRLAALVPMMMIPLAAAGAVWIVDLVTALVARDDSGRRDVARAASSAVAVGAIAIIGIGVVAAEPLVLRYTVSGRSYQAQSTYVVNDRSWLQVDERALLERLSDDVPKGATVLNNPGTGAAWGYFFSGVDVYPAKWQVPTTPAYSLLKEKLHLVASDPQVCAAVRELKADYVLDFGAGGKTEPGLPAPAKVLPAFTGFGGVRGFELVDHQGEAKLWRITECASAHVG